jgi:hypothetical protein
MKAIKLLAGLMMVTLTLVMMTPQKAEASEAREYAVKAAYLFKFLNLIQWPNEAKIESFAVGVVGPGPFGPSLDDIEGKLVRGKPLRVVTYPIVQSPQPSEQMILFIDNANDSKLEGVLRDLKGQNVLTVGESKRFAERGGCINLVTVKNRVRFRINVDAVRRAQLKISPRLVKIASVLVTDSGKKASYDDYKDILAYDLDETTNM